ncbi:MAG TPA: YceI family protein [Thermoanaerobaculia bacterium]|jgi:polyisoprenoid-binding protein YceI|nr:YceI family protein [Thermoanaerobaculia bacterium]
MRSKRFVVALLLVLALPALASAAPVVYKIDPDHSSVTFSIRHFVSNVHGRFKDFDGTVKYDKQNPTASTVEFTTQVASIDTDNKDRDNHLKTPEFFDAAKFPTMTFTSTAVKPKDANTLDVTGNLTIHGVTKPVTIPVSVLGTVATKGGDKAGFETAFTVDRKDYGVEWNRVLDTGGTMLGNDVKISISVEANTPKPAEPKKSK